MRRGNGWVKLVMGLCFGYGLVLALARPATPTVQFPPQPQLKVQLGHSRGVNAVAFSLDGRWLLTGSEDGTAILLEAKTGLEIRQFVGHSAPISSVAFSPSASRVLTGGCDGTAILWNTETGTQLHRFAVNSDNCVAVAFSPDGQWILTGGGDGTVQIWDAGTGEEIRRFLLHSDRVQSISFSADKQNVLTGSRDGAVLLWNTATGEVIQRFRGQLAALSNDGQLVLTGGRDGDVRLWEIATGKQVRRFEGHGHQLITSAASHINSVAFSKDDRRLLTASEDWTARLWNATTGLELRRFKSPCGGISQAAFSPDEHFVVTGESCEMARLWDESTGLEVRRFVGKSEWVTSLDISPDGRKILFATSDDKTARLWDAATGTEVRRYVRSSWLPWVGFAPDGQSILLAEGYARLVDIATGQEVRRFSGGGVTSAAFSRDGRLVLTRSWMKDTAELWEVASGKELQRFVGHPDLVTGVALSPGGDRAATSSNDRTIRIWNTANGETIRTLGPVRDKPGSVALSPDSKYVAVGVTKAVGLLAAMRGGTAGEAILWDIETGREVHHFRGHTKGVSSVAFSPTGEQLLTGGKEGTAILWDAQTGKQLRRFIGHSQLISSVVFFPDGRHIATGSWDGTVRIWDLAKDTELCRLIAFRDRTWAVVDPEGRFDASNGGDVEGLHWVVGNETIALSQLKERYYEPGLLAKVLGFNKEPLRDVSAFTKVALYPAIELRQPTAENSTLIVKLTNRGGGIGKVIVSIKGKEVTADARGRGVDPEAEFLVVSVDLANHPYLIPGTDNVIEVRALNAEGYLSSRGVTVFYRPPGEAPSQKPTLWSIVAGVSDYMGERIDLRYAAKDAADMAKALNLGATRLFGAERVELTLLSTTKSSMLPTKANIKAAFEQTGAAKPWDILVVYMAGHGVALGDTYYYLTQEARSTDLTDPAIRAQAAISSEEMVSWLKQSPALKQVMVLDTCAAGTAARKLVEQRNLSSDQIRAIERLKDRTGFHVLMGSAADAVSYEATQYEQGLLTHALLQGMRGAALREEEYVDVSRLFQHAADVVPTLASRIGGIQRPRIAAPKGTSFDIGQLKEEDRRQIVPPQSKPMLLAPVLLNFEEGFDNLELTGKVRQYLREQSYASLRGAPRRLPAVYVDADQLAGAVRPSGTYQVKANKVRVSLVLVKDGNKLASLQVDGSADDLEGLTQIIVNEILQALPRIKQ